MGMNSCVTGLLALTFSCAGYAQSIDPQSRDVDGKSEAAYQESTNETRGEAATTDMTRMHPGETASANKLIGAAILTLADKKEIGEVEDIVLDREQERIAYVVTAYGGVLGMGEKFFAMPWSAFQIQSGDATQLLLDVNPDQLAEAPGFDKDNWPEAANPAFARKAYEFYGQQPYRLSDERRADEQPAAPNTVRETYDLTWMGWDDRDETWTRRLSTLIETVVEDSSNANIAKLKDVIVDIQEGRAVYGILEYGGFVGLFDSVAAVPFAALNFNMERDTLALHGGIADLNALKIESDDYSELEQTQFAERIFRQFDEEPYWIAFRDMRAEKTITRDVRPSDESQMAQSQEITGTIESIEALDTEQAGAANEGMRIDLKTADGSCVVHAGSSAELEDKDINLHAGDKVTVTGTMENVNGEQILIAERLEKDGETVMFRMSQAKPMQQSERLSNASPL